MDFPDFLSPFISIVYHFQLCPYKAVLDKFKLVVQHFLFHVKESMGEHYLWVHPYFSSSVLHVLFV